jgi:hypothetical protein
VGTTGRIQQTSHEEEEGISVEAHGRAIVEALGINRCALRCAVLRCAALGAGSGA